MYLRIFQRVSMNLRENLAFCGKSWLFAEKSGMNTGKGGFRGWVGLGKGASHGEASRVGELEGRTFAQDEREWQEK